MTSIEELTPPDTAHATPPVTVLVCTRNRGGMVATTIRSIFANNYSDFELLVIDQSDDARTAQAIVELCRDRRLRYIRTHSRGLSAARNLGLACSTNELVLMTDDDCEVPADWIERMVEPFLRHPKVGLVFCNVTAGPHDPKAGFVPVSESAHPLMIEDLAHWQTCDGVNLGIGAGMAVRRRTAEAIGGFDCLFGPGSLFRNGEDLDFALRLLVSRGQIYRLAEVAVLHHGFRTFAEGRRLMRDSMFSVGAIYGRLIRGGHWRALLFFARVLWAMVFAPTVSNLLRLRIPPVLGRLVWLLVGLARGAARA